jgi:hypothetical protein
MQEACGAGRLILGKRRTWFLIADRMTSFNFGFPKLGDRTRHTVTRIDRAGVFRIFIRHNRRRCDGLISVEPVEIIDL